MGVLADLFVATRDEAVLYESSHGRGREQHIARYEPVEYRSLTSLNFETLWPVLVAETWDEDAHSLDYVAFGDGTCLCRFPEPFVTALAELDDFRAPDAAEAWALTDEDVHPSDAGLLLGDLVRMARSARATGTELWLWSSP